MQIGKAKFEAYQPDFGKRKFQHSDEWKAEVEALLGSLVMQVNTLKAKVHILENKGDSA